MSTSKIHIIGIGDDGLEGVISPARQLVEQAQLLIGAESTLARLPKLSAERLVVGSNLDEAIDRMQQERKENDDSSPLFEAFQHLGSGWVSAILARLSLQITLGSLVEGQHVETESLEEIVAVENVIKEGVSY